MKKFLLVGVIIALLAGGVAVFKILSQEPKIIVDDSTAKPNAAVETKKVEFTPISGTDSLNTLLALNQNMECTISYQSKGSVDSPTEGTLFTSRNRLRGDFIIPGMGTDAVSSMILLDSNWYFWTEIGGEKNGMKISLNELLATKKNDNAPEAGEAIPLDAPVNYECKPWSIIDGSIFEPPTDIIFKDYSDVINNGMEYGTIYE